MAALTVIGMIGMIGIIAIKEAESLLQGVLASTDREKEFYNGGRAILELAKRKQAANEALSP